MAPHITERWKASA